MRHSSVGRTVPFKSIFRQPGRTILFIAMIALISFAFTIRIFEAFIVEQEINRLEAKYRAIGTIAPLEPLHWSINEARELLEASPIVEYTDNLRVIQGVMDSIYTPDTGGFVPFVNKMFVYGTLGWKEHIAYIDFFSEENRQLLAESHPIFPYVDIYYFTFYVDTVVAGLPEHVTPGRQLQVTLLDYRQHLSHVFEQAEIGQRYFLGGQFSSNINQLYFERYFYGAIIFLPHPTRKYLAHVGGGRYDLTLHPLNPAGDLFLYPVGEDGQVETPEVLTRLEEEIAVLQQNLQTIFLRPTRDLTANPLSRTIGRSSLFLADGRFIDSIDDEMQNPVAVIRQEFATLRGLEVGDTLTVTMRESPFATEYLLPDSSRTFIPRWLGERVPAAEWILEFSPFADAIYYDGRNYVWDSIWFNPWNLTTEITALEMATGYITDRETHYNRSRSENIHHWQDMETQTISLEIVGIYFVDDELDASQTIFYNNVYVPDSIVPASWTQDVLYSNFSFVLTSGRYEKDFKEIYQPLLAELGFLPNFLESGWETFNATVSPIRSGLLMGIFVFAFLTLIVFSLVISLYFIQRRKEFAIMRALGSAKNKATKDIALPITLMGLFGLIVGQLPAWFFSLNRAQDTLVALDEVGYSRIEIDLSWILFFLTLAALFIFFLGLILLVANRLTRFPALELLQGNAATKKRTSLLKKWASSPKAIREIESEEAPFDNFSSPSLVYLPFIRFSNRNNFPGLPHLLFLIRKRLIHQKGRSILGVMIAAGFMAILSFIPFSIAENEALVDWLFDHTEVEGTIILDPMGGEWARRFRSGAHTFTIRDVMALEDDIGVPLVSSYFAASGSSGALIPAHFSREEFEHIWEHFDDEPRGQVEITTFNNLARYEEFFDESFHIIYLEGFDDNIFEYPIRNERSVIISSSVQAYWEVSPGDFLNLHNTYAFECQQTGAWVTVLGRQHTSYRIVGIVEDGCEPTMMALIPLEDMHAHRVHLMHNPFEITVNPALNREIDAAQEAIRETLATNVPPFILFLRDYLLRDGVEALERNIAMMRQLYPIIVGLSLLIALGLTLLMLLPSVKEVATLRVTGMSKIRIMVLLFLERIFITMVGLGLGGLISHLAFDRLNPFAIYTYLTGAIIALILFGILFIRIKPMELLQVKE